MKMQQHHLKILGLKIFLGHRSFRTIDQSNQKSTNEKTVIETTRMSKSTRCKNVKNAENKNKIEKNEQIINPFVQN